MKYAACVGLLLAATAAAPVWASSTIINVDATEPGKVVTLGPGDYKLEFIGKAEGGTYDAWNAWTFSNPDGETTGCTVQGTGCQTGWLMSSAIDWGYGVGNFDDSDVTYLFSNDPSGGKFASPLLALADINAPGRLSASSTAAALAAGRPAGIFSGGLLFKLAAAQDLRFRVGDNIFYDNVGGLSVRLTEQIATPGGVPEPATWAMMIAGFGLIGGSMRRRTRIRLAMA